MLTSFNNYIVSWSFCARVSRRNAAIVILWKHPSPHTKFILCSPEYTNHINALDIVLQFACTQDKNFSIIHNIMCLNVYAKQRHNMSWLYPFLLKFITYINYVPVFTKEYIGSIPIFMVIFLRTIEALRMQSR